MDFLIAPLFIIALLALVRPSNNSEKGDQASQDSNGESKISLEISTKDFESLTRQLSKSAATK